MPIRAAIGRFIGAGRLTVPPQAESRESPLDWLFPALLFALALAIRLPLVRFGAPYVVTWDENDLLKNVLTMMVEPGLKPGFQVYGDLVSYVALIAEIPALLISYTSGLALSLDDFLSPPTGAPSIHWAVGAGGLPLLAPRTAFAVLASCGAVGTFQAARRVCGVDPWSALCAGIVVAVMGGSNLEQTAHIHPEPLALALLAFLLVSAFIAVESGSLAAHLAVGALIGLLLATKTQFLPAIVVLPVAVLVDRTRARRYRKLVAGSLCAFAAFLLTSPYILLDLPHFLRGAAYPYHWVGDSGASSDPELVGTPGWSQVTYYVAVLFAGAGGSLRSGLGIVVGLCAGIGLAMLWVIRWRFAAIITVYIVASLLALSRFPLHHSRYAIQFFPFIAVAVATCLAVLGRLALKVGSVRWRTGTGPAAGTSRFPIGSWSVGLSVLFLVANIPSFGSSYAFLRDRADYVQPQVAAAAFLGSDRARGKRAAIFSFVPWDLADLDRRHIEYVRFDPSVVSPERLAKYQFDYVIGTDRVGDAFKLMMGMKETPALTAWFDYLRRTDRRVAEFGQYPLEHPMYASYLTVVEAPGSGEADRSPNLLADGDSGAGIETWQRLRQGGDLDLTIEHDPNGAAILHIRSTSGAGAGVFQKAVIDRQSRYLFTAWVRVTALAPQTRFLYWECPTLEASPYCGSSTEPVAPNTWTLVATEIQVPAAAKSGDVTLFPVLSGGPTDISVRNVGLWRIPG